MWKYCGAQPRSSVFDRDFGALAFKLGLAVPAGILLLRLVPRSPEEPAGLVLDLLGDAGIVFPGRFTIADRERVRQRIIGPPDERSATHT